MLNNDPYEKMLSSETDESSRIHDSLLEKCNYLVQDPNG